MSTITIGAAPAELTAVVSAQQSISTNPDVFAAQLQSATDGVASVSRTQTGPPTNPLSAQAGTGAAVDDPQEAITAAAAPAGAITPPPLVATESLPTPLPTSLPDPVPASLSSVRPDANTPRSAQTSTPDEKQPSSSTGGDDLGAMSASRPVSSAVALSPAAVATGRRGPRHAANDALPSPVVAASAIGLGAVTSTSAASLTLVQTDGGSPVGENGAIQSAIDTNSTLTAVVAAAPAAAENTGARSVEDPAGPPPTPDAPLPTLVGATPLPATSAVGNSSRPAVRVVATSASDPHAFAAALAQPSVSRAVIPSAGPTPSAGPPTLVAQLAPPLFALRSAGTGIHILTVTVSPESIGPVTVRAHVTDGSMRVELSAPTDQGTAALHALLPELKRDLSQGGANSAVTVASPNSDGAAAGNPNTAGGAGGFFRDDRPNYFRAESTPPLATTVSSPRPVSVGTVSGLDVLA